MLLFDTHCHYNLEPLYGNWQKHWQTAQEHGVVGSIVVGTEVDTSKRALEIASINHEILYAAIGIHPCFWQGHDNSLATVVSEGYISQEVSKLEQLLHHPNSSRLAAIGEIGLDYFRIRTHPEFKKLRDNQLVAFRRQLELVSNPSYTLQDMPVILHVRDIVQIDSQQTAQTDISAYQDILDVTKEFPQLKCILHCVSGPSMYVSEMISRGAYVSFAGNVTYPSAQALRDLAPFIPKDRVLIETDAPFLTPQTYRGQKCEPYMIEATGKFMCELFDVSPDIIIENTSRCFNIPTIPGTITK